MDFQFDSLSAIQKRIENDLISSLSPRQQEAGFFEKSLARVLSATLAPMINYLYMFIRWCSAQMFPWSATGKYLLRHASFYGINKAFSTFSAGKITVLGDPGSLIKTGAKIKASNEKIYITRSDTLISGTGSAEADIIASDPGASSNIVTTDVTFKFQETIEGIRPDAEFLGPITGGLDEPTDREIQNKIRIKAQAIHPTGSASDYISGALMADGVSGAWVFPRGIQKINGFVSVIIISKIDGDWVSPSEDKRVACYKAINLIRPDTDIFSPRDGVIIPVLINVDIVFTALPGQTPEIMLNIEKEFKFIVNNLAPGEAMDKNYNAVHDTLDIESLNAALYSLRLSRFRFEILIDDYEITDTIKARRNHLFRLGSVTPPGGHTIEF